MVAPSLPTVEQCIHSASYSGTNYDYQPENTDQALDDELERELFGDLKQPDDAATSRSANESNIHSTDHSAVANDVQPESKQDSPASQTFDKELDDELDLMLMFALNEPETGAATIAPVAPNITKPSAANNQPPPLSQTTDQDSDDELESALLSALNEPDPGAATIAVAAPSITNSSTANEKSIPAFVLKRRKYKEKRLAKKAGRTSTIPAAQSPVPTTTTTIVPPPPFSGVDDAEKKLMESLKNGGKSTNAPLVKSAGQIVREKEIAEKLARRQAALKGVRSTMVTAPSPLRNVETASAEPPNMQQRPVSAANMNKETNTDFSTSDHAAPSHTSTTTAEQPKMRVPKRKRQDDATIEQDEPTSKKRSTGSTNIATPEAEKPKESVLKRKREGDATTEEDEQSAKRRFAESTDAATPEEEEMPKKGVLKRKRGDDASTEQDEEIEGERPKKKAAGKAWVSWPGL